MQAFQATHRQLDLQRHYLLEASAGTGKTFSIENIVVRLLIDPLHPCEIEEIVVVTFTRAAAADLRLRIRRALDGAMSTLSNGSQPSQGIPDYLLAIIEQGSDASQWAARQLEAAIAFFDQAPIFTIHGFCSRMLRDFPIEAGVNVANFSDEMGIPPSTVYSCIRDFFRSGLHSDLLTPGQLQILLAQCRGVKGLERHIYKLLQQGLKIVPARSAKQLLAAFIDAMQAIKSALSPLPHLIVEDFSLQAPYYKSICDRQHRPKSDKLAKISRFACLFEQEQWSGADLDLLIADGLYIVDALDCSQLTAKCKGVRPDLSLHYPAFIDLCCQHLLPIVAEARQPENILASLAHGCQMMANIYNQRHDLMSFNDILTAMSLATAQNAFIHKVQSRFKAAIIDEFQDTDPVQWEIFQRLFLANDYHKTHLYLVGDPKQSIYGFRQADIYTYLLAGDHLGDNAKASLDTNYRSTDALVEALNGLFCENNAPGLIALPRIGQALPYLTVKSSGKIAPKVTDHNRGAIHFCLPSARDASCDSKLIDFEASLFLPFVVSELMHLRDQHGLAYSQSAILVADRFQAMRVADYLTAAGIPSAVQRSQSLLDTLAYPVLLELMQGMLAPRHDSSLKIALAGPLIGWSADEIMALEDFSVKEELLSKWMPLRQCWFEHGFAAFFRQLMCVDFHNDGLSAAEHLLSTPDGYELYNHIRQLSELLIEYEATHQAFPQQLVSYLNRLSVTVVDDNPALKVRSDPLRQGVRVVTMHSSKGLEYDVVFALGVICRSPKPPLIIPVSSDEGKMTLCAVTDDEDARYVAHCQELNAEKIRQLYVAFTRAKQRLYIPVMDFDQLKSPQLGVAAPLELYFEQVAKAWSLKNSTDGKLSVEMMPTIREFLKALCDEYDISCLPLEKQMPLNSTQQLTFCQLPPLELTLPSKPVIPVTNKYIHSFTALSAGHGQSSPSVILKDVPKDFDCEQKTFHTLPAGSEIGILLHEILEEIPFDVAACGPKDRCLQEIVFKHLQHSPFSSWQDVICDMIYGALTAILPAIEPFSLFNVSSANCYREHEFTYGALPHLHETFSSKPGYVKGVIDMLFSYKDKYYLLDWKSNWLGPDDQAYDQAGLKNAMEANNYFLQADLYRHAFSSYLKMCDPRPFEEIFGGIFYVFLRGVSSSSSRGIFFSY